MTECRRSFDLESDNPNDLEIDIYAAENFRQLAEQCVAEGLFGETPKHLLHYVNYDAIAYDLSIDCAEVTIGGQKLVYCTD